MLRPPWPGYSSSAYRSSSKESALFPTCRTAFGALLILLAVLVASSLLLVPGQSIQLGGIEVLVIGLIVWITTISLDVRIWGHTALPVAHPSPTSMMRTGTPVPTLP